MRGCGGKLAKDIITYLYRYIYHNCTSCIVRFSLQDRRPRQNDKAKEQEWFLGVFDEAENRSISLPFQPVVGPTCDLLQVQMTENQDDDELAAVIDDVAF